MLFIVALSTILMIPIPLACITDFHEVFSQNGTLSLKILQNYALSKINTDRLSDGLNPISISDNKAAQYHAAEILRTELLSHWSKNGLKPYML
jgi:hypothetical protein